MSKKLLQKAISITFDRKEEKERQYGPFVEGMSRASKILEGMTGKKIEVEFMYQAMIALKLSRQSYNHKEDNLLDAVSYIASMNEHLSGAEECCGSCGCDDDYINKNTTIT